MCSLAVITSFDDSIEYSIDDPGSLRPFTDDTRLIYCWMYFYNTFCPYTLFSIFCACDNACMDLVLPNGFTFYCFIESFAEFFFDTLVPWSCYLLFDGWFSYFDLFYPCFQSTSSSLSTLFDLFDSLPTIFCDYLTDCSSANRTLVTFESLIEFIYYSTYSIFDIFITDSSTASRRFQSKQSRIQFPNSLLPNFYGLSLTSYVFLQLFWGFVSEMKFCYLIAVEALPNTDWTSFLSSRFSYFFYYRAIYVLDLIRLASIFSLLGDRLDELFFYLLLLPNNFDTIPLNPLFSDFSLSILYAYSFCYSLLNFDNSYFRYLLQIIQTSAISLTQATSASNSGSAGLLLKIGH